MSSVDRVIDAVNEAKPTKEADLSQINLSERLIDQKIIYIPRKGETIVSSPQSSNKTSSTSNQNQQINLNNATEADLKKYPVLDPQKLRKYSTIENKSGGFNSIEDLKKLKVLKKKLMKSLKINL